MYIHTYIYTYTYIYIYTYTYISINISRGYIHRQAIYIYRYSVSPSLSLYIYIQTIYTEFIYGLYKHTHIIIHTCMHRFIHSYIHTYLYPQHCWQKSQVTQRLGYSQVFGWPSGGSGAVRGWGRWGRVSWSPVDVDFFRCFTGKMIYNFGGFSTFD